MGPPHDLDCTSPIDPRDIDARLALANELGVTDERLLAAVVAVGTMPKAIRFYLTTKSRKLKETNPDEYRSRIEKRQARQARLESVRGAQATRQLSKPK